LRYSRLVSNRRDGAAWQRRTAQAGQRESILQRVRRLGRTGARPHGGARRRARIRHGLRRASVHVIRLCSLQWNRLQLAAAAWNRRLDGRRLLVVAAAEEVRWQERAGVDLRKTAPLRRRLADLNLSG
jgi:hypothetical protein